MINIPKKNLLNSANILKKISDTLDQSIYCAKQSIEIEFMVTINWKIRQMVDWMVRKCEKNGFEDERYVLIDYHVI